LAVKKYRRRIQLETGIVQVALWIEGVRYQVNALIDTGNQLYDPYRNRPVHILEKSVIEEVVQKENESYLYIPYQSLGKEAGILPVYCVEQLVIHTRHQEIVLYNQLVGLTDLTLNTHRSYQMLLHAEIMTAHQEGKMIC
jgi:sigma-E processing peptidase SpoIIGA